MTTRAISLRLLVAGLAVAMPALLLVGALRTLHKLDHEKEGILRSQAAGIAARLETLPDIDSLAEVRQEWMDEDPAVTGIAIFRYDDPNSGAPAALLDGQQLFLMEYLPVDSGGKVFRVWLPCHVAGAVYLARVDLAEDAAARLLEPARQNVWVASAGALAMIGLSLVLVWMQRRAAVAEQRQLELQHLARIGEMSAVLAHEIRNPLGTIKGFAQLLAERANDEQKALIEPVVSETVRLEHLVKDLLLYGRPPKVELREADVAALGRTLAGHARQAIGASGTHFELKAPPSHWHTDAALLEQALLNLLRNAIEAVEGRPGARVQLIFEEAGRVARVTVTDNGPGLTAEQRSRLFEPFCTTKVNGTGLGLAITKRLVESMGGRLEMLDGEEGGVAAVITLPLAKPDGERTDSGS